MQLFIRNKSFYKTLVAFALPVALQSAITVGVNLADNVMLGQLGEIGMSSATLANNFISIYQVSTMGLGMGASVLVSRFFGMKDHVCIKKTVNIMFRVEFVLALLFSCLTAMFPNQIMGLFTNDTAVINGGVGYLLWSIPCYFLNGYALTTSLMLRSIGKANIPLYASIASFFVNIFFNWVFIFGNLGAPVMGVNGAALGTLLARVIEFGVTMTFLFYIDDKISFRIRDLGMEVKDLFPTYLNISLPVLASDAILGIGNSAAASIMGHIGSEFVAANSITTVTMHLATVIMSGIAQASCSVTGITLGEGKIEKAKLQGRTFISLGFIVGAMACGIILLIKNWVISLYNISADTVNLAVQLMNALAVSVVFMAENMILTKGLLRGGGDTRFLVTIDFICLWLVCIPLGYLSALVWNWSGFWVFITLRCDAIIKCVIAIGRLCSGKWIKKIAVLEKTK